ncbi:Pr6Pr family membrane protein [Chachezhania sediminis]|uniref:Pr6Pr family membrane protein n=1 Tax=Chachezhania sediminis TaxID=2599291 RepID=UPI00131E3C96|nr:Pr6Pr family membrane protein [Chachezhania sediminis]
MNIARLLALLAALNSGVAVVWRLTLDLKDTSFGTALWDLSGFFTIWTNTAVALVALAMALAPNIRLAAPPVRHAVAVAILGVGIVYSVALRHVMDFTGAGAVVNHMFHDLAPPLFLLAWLAAGHGTLKPVSIPLASVFPGIYLSVAMIRGAATGWYPYWFLNPDKIGLAHLALTVVLICGLFSILAAVLWAIDRLIARNSIRKTA